MYKRNWSPINKIFFNKIMEIIGLFETQQYFWISQYCVNLIKNGINILFDINLCPYYYLFNIHLQPNCQLYYCQTWLREILVIAYLSLRVKFYLILTVFYFINAYLVTGNLSLKAKFCLILTAVKVKFDSKGYIL